MRVIAIDHGGRRTGIAIAETDASNTGTALPFEMFEGLPDAQLSQAIRQLVRSEAVDVIVVGLPLHGDGGISAQTKIVERFITTLRAAIDPQIPIHRFSEYLSSHDSEGKLAGHFTRNQKRQRVDALAAARILQDWLDHHNRTPSP